MISNSHLIEWQRTVAPWSSSEQVEHDIVLSRAICELYQNPVISEKMAFRGGTALYKLFLNDKARFSEDLDFVQIDSSPIGDLVQAIHDSLDSWLGKPRWKQNQGRFTLYYSFLTEVEPIVKRKVKIEINTREHFTTDGHKKIPFEMNSGWFSGKVDVITYSLEELIGTKLRALYQRKKGRDLYDLWVTLNTHTDLNIDSVIRAFNTYTRFVNASISRAEFEKNLYCKRSDHDFSRDIFPLLSSEYHDSYRIEEAFEMVQKKLISRLAGEPWKCVEEMQVF